MEFSKKVLFLIVAVLLVWGMIGYRIISALNDDSEGNSGPVKSTATKMVDSLPSYTISLNYRDPFFPAKPVARQLSVVRKPVASSERKAAPKVAEKWEEIIFLGCFNSGKVQILTVRIAGEEIFVRRGDLYDKYTFEDIWMDSVRIRNGSEVKTFYKNPKK